LSLALTNAFSAALGRRVVWPWWVGTPRASVTVNFQAGLCSSSKATWRAYQGFP
jgi:hypothetical protein